MDDHQRPSFSDAGQTMNATILRPSKTAALPLSQMASGLLIQGEERLACWLVESFNGGFTVFVPPASKCKRRSRARLLIEDVVHEIRTTRVTSVEHGMLVTLRTVRESARAVIPVWRSAVYGSICCAMLAIELCGTLIPEGSPNDVVQFGNWPEIVGRWIARWTTPSPGNTANGVDAATVKSVAAIDHSAGRTVPTPSHESPIPAIRVSMESRPAASTGSTKQQEEASEIRDRLVRSALSSSESHRSRPVNAATLPWLLSSPGHAESKLNHCRMSESAAGDLQMFQSCLKSLTASEAAEATKGLRDALAAIEAAPATAPDVPGFSGIKRVCCADAEVYFRIQDGEAELLRILPAEIGSDASLNPGLDAVHRTAAHR